MVSEQGALGAIEPRLGRSVSIDQASQLLHVSRRTIYNRIRDGRLQTIKSYDLADGRDITMVARITPTAGKELTVLEQIMGNVGRFSGPRQETNPGAPTGGGI